MTGHEPKLELLRLRLEQARLVPSPSCIFTFCFLLPSLLSSLFLLFFLISLVSNPPTHTLALYSNSFLRAIFLVACVILFFPAIGAGFNPDALGLPQMLPVGNTTATPGDAGKLRLPFELQKNMFCNMCREPDHREPEHREWGEAMMVAFDQETIDHLVRGSAETISNAKPPSPQEGNPFLLSSLSGAIPTILGWVVSWILLRWRLLPLRRIPFFFVDFCCVVSMTEVARRECDVSAL